MLSKDLGWLVLLWAFGSGKRTSSPSSPSSPEPWQLPPPAPSRPQRPPPGRGEPTDPGPIPLATDAELLNPPAEPSVADLLWSRYAGDTRREGPRISKAELEQSTPITRPLTEFERWALAPYFPAPGQLDATIHNGKYPTGPDIDPAQVRKMVADQKISAITDPREDHKGEIWFPGDGPVPLWSRWWMSCLAHELAHVFQFKMGMTLQQGIQARLKHGYIDSPIERQARALQAVVLRDLYERARKFYADRRKQ